MPGTIVPGQVTWNLVRDEEGHREYKIKHLVRVEPGEGPYAAMCTPGLPIPGAIWNFDNEYDPYAWCRPNAIVQIHEEKQGDPAEYYTVEQTFSTKPLPADQQRCYSNEVGDPLCEPQKVSGKFVKYMEEAAYDRFGLPIVNSAFEQMRGPQVEFEANRPSIRIEQNVMDLELDLLYSMVDTVNDAPLWGLPVRCVKLSNVSWERKFYGQLSPHATGTGTDTVEFDSNCPGLNFGPGYDGTGTDCTDRSDLCHVYYTRILDFDINYKRNPLSGELTSGFDRDLLDEGTKVLNGHWNRTTGHYVTDPIEGYGGSPNPDPTDPTHFKAYTDRPGNVTRVVLNGAGMPAGSVIGSGTDAIESGSPGNIHVEKYDETNFLLLNIVLDF